MDTNRVRSHSVRPRFSERLRADLGETAAHTQGRSEIPSAFLTLLEPPPAYDAARIRALRTDLGLSQPYFSKLLNVSPKTVQSWEQGTRTPGQSSARLLQLIENPHLLDAFR